MKEFLLKLVKRKLFLTLVVFILLYKAVFNSFTGDILLPKIIGSVSTGSLTCNVKRFSLFFGFIIEDLSLNSGADYDKKPVFKAKRLAITYNIPLLLLGRLKLSEISLTKPEIYLTQRNKIWNINALFPPGPEEKEEPKTEEEPLGDEINLHLPVSAYLNFFIEDLKFFMEAEPGEGYFKANLENFSLYLKMDTKRFSRLPLSTKIFSIMEVLSLKLNPDKKLELEALDNTTSIKTPISFKWIIEKDVQQTPLLLHSSLDISHDSIPIKMKSGTVAPFNLQLGYNLNYSPEEDSLTLENLLIAFASDKWLHANGAIKNLLKPERELKFTVLESNINLDNVERVTDTIPIIPRMDMTGSLSLMPFKAEGKLTDLKVQSDIHGSGIIVSLGGQTHNIPKLLFDFDALLDVMTEEKSTEKDILPLVKILEIHNLEGQYNGVKLNIHGTIAPEDKVDLKLILDRVVIANFVPDLFGNAKLNIDVTGDKLSYLNLQLKVLVENFRYKMGRAMSGISNLDLFIKTAIDFKKDFQLETLTVDPLTVNLKNENRELGAKIQGKLKLDMRGKTEAKLEKLNIDANLTNIIPTLPVVLRGTIGGIRTSLGKELKLSGTADYLEEKGKKNIAATLNGAFPALELEDLGIGIKAKIDNDKNETITIDTISLSAFENKLKALFKGQFYKPRTASPPFGEYAGELGGNLTLESEKFRYVLKGISFKGDLDIDVNVKDNIIKGELRTLDSSMIVKSGTCPGKDCSTTELNSLKMKIPFLHDLADTSTENLLEGNKSKFVKSYGQDEPPNLSIKSVSINHPSIDNARLEVVKPQGEEPGFNARVDYFENFLSIDDLKIHSLNGFVYGKDIVFNIGSGKPEFIQYTAVLQIRDIDLRELLPANVGKKIDDGKIKADLNISGQNLKDPIDNLELFFSTFQIGKDFGKSAINIVSPENLITDAIINSYRVDKLQVELTKGLVYAQVSFSKSIMNTLLFSVDKDMISQERIPLGSFLKRTENELATYK